MANVIGTKVLLTDLEGVITEVVYFADQNQKETYRVNVQIHPCYSVWLTKEEYEDDSVKILEADDWWESYDSKTGQYLGYEKPMYK